MWFTGLNTRCLTRCSHWFGVKLNVFFYTVGLFVVIELYIGNSSASEDGRSPQAVRVICDQMFIIKIKINAVNFATK